MTIKMRLISMMAVAIIGFSTVFLTATFGLEKLSDHISEVGEHRMPHLLIAEDVISESLAFQRDILRLILIDDPARKERIHKRILDTRTHIAQLSEELAHALQSAEAKQLLSEINALRQEPVKFNNQIMELIANHQTSQATEIATGIAYRDSYEAYISKMRDMVAFEKELARKEIDQGESDTLSAKVWILGISAVVLIALVLFSIFVIRSVSNAVQQLVVGVSRVTQTATFDTRLSPRDDELNEVISNLNHLFSSLETAIKASNHVVSAIAKADFTQRMQGSYVGDLAQLQQGINASAESVAFMMHELELVMNSLNAGKFDTRMDTKVPQAFRNLVEQALTNIHAVISDINQVMGKLNQGDFSARVQSQAQGDLQSMKNNINDSMMRLSDAVSGITTIVTAQSQGDLSKQLQLDLKGQLQTLKEAINHSSQQLKNIVSQAVNASNVVDSAAGQVSHSASNLSYRIQEQAAAIEETSATMTEMASAVQANTSNARQVADLTSQVKKQASDGVSVMQETIVAMQSIQESSNKIADIVSMIDAIAFQTNLLALNAAVEAARAGEHGRGFAVVAGEVRALAQKSADAARDIKHLIDDSVTRVGNGTQLAQKSGQVLNSIANAIQNVAGMVDAIAHASHEQSDGIEQVHKSISDIDRVTQENSTLVEQTNTASSRLEDEANKLRHSMEFFKT